MKTSRRIILVALLAALPAGRLVAQNPAAFLVDGPEEGQRAPLFTLDAVGRDGPADRPFDLSLQLGRTVVLAFYQRDFTPTATREMTTFAERFADLFGDSTAVVGVGVDSSAVHLSFAQSLALPFPLLADTGLHVAKLYGSMRNDGYARYSIYVIGPDGRVRWRDLRFDPNKDGAYEDLRRAVRPRSPGR
ncbi:MAG: peroxiredoxin family protein [Gemmatimonadales bacterium]